LKKAWEGVMEIYRSMWMWMESVRYRWACSIKVGPTCTAVDDQTIYCSIQVGPTYHPQPESIRHAASSMLYACMSPVNFVRRIHIHSVALTTYCAATTLADDR
jgi:hypothetical protein